MFAANVTCAGAQGWDRKYEVVLYLKQAFCITVIVEYEVLQQELKVHLEVGRQSNRRFCLDS